MGRQSDAKERLMEAVLELTVNGSFGALRIDDICKKAEVKKGSFYYFFPSKEDLLIAALEDLWLTEWKPYLERHFSSGEPPLECLRSYLAKGVECQERAARENGRVCGCGILSLASEVTLLDERVAAITRDIFARKRRYFETCIKDAVAQGEIPPGGCEARAAGLWALIEGALVQARVLNDLTPLRYLPDLAVALLKSPLACAACPVTDAKEVGQTL